MHGPMNIKCTTAFAEMRYNFLQLCYASYYACCFSHQFNCIYLDLNFNSWHKQRA